jgi:hypothetical protein
MRSSAAASRRGADRRAAASGSRTARFEAATPSRSRSRESPLARRALAIGICAGVEETRDALTSVCEVKASRDV